jgi:hypothetical protein
MHVSSVEVHPIIREAEIDRVVLERTKWAGIFDVSMRRQRKNAL